MKPEDLMHAMNHLDPDLVERAEQPGTRRKPRVRRIAVLAACLAAMVVGVSAGASAGLFDAYFGGESNQYQQQLLSAAGSVSSGTVELRLEGAAADRHTVQLVVSFLGLTPESKQALAAGDLAQQGKFDLYALSETGQRIDFPSTESGTYTETGKAVTLLADADMTYLLTGTFEDTGLDQVATVCFAYEDLVLEADLTGCTFPEYQLEPAGGTGSLTGFSASAIGFYFTMASSDEPAQVRLIRADGSVEKDTAFRASWSGEDGQQQTAVTGVWCGGSPVAMGVLDLDQYQGIQVNGEKYLFVH